MPCRSEPFVRCAARPVLAWGREPRDVWGCMKYELQQMRKQGSGIIVNCSSLGGIVDGADCGSYHEAKHGIASAWGPG